MKWACPIPFILRTGIDRQFRQGAMFRKSMGYRHWRILHNSLDVLDNWLDPALLGGASVALQTGSGVLIHQDYTDHARKPAIRIYDDRTIFWNPGDAFSSVDDLLDPGEKEIRNPRIVATFRRIGSSEQAGTGIRAIVYNWVRLGRVPPQINNDRSCKAFELILVKEELLSEKQLLLQASLGVRLGDAEARVFAFACREGGVNVRDVRSISRPFEADGRIVLQHLKNQGLIAPVEGGESSFFVIAEHIKLRLESQRHQQAGGGACDPIADHPMESGMNLSTAQPDSDLEDLSTAQDTALPLTDEWTAISPVSGPDLQTAKGVLHVESRFDTVLLTVLSSTQKRIIEFCDTPRRLAEIMDALGAVNRGYFKKHHLDPLLQGVFFKWFILTNPTTHIKPMC